MDNNISLVVICTKYYIYLPYSLKKKRVFTYTTENANTPEQQKLIKEFGKEEYDRLMKEINV